ncbi:hypothetical protein BDR05DRAFT_742890 [Suillus weaverae]|nr:hypothetical protein BDR05DRAFT_742890 [Suillus weaverae]
MHPSSRASSADAVAKIRWFLGKVKNAHVIAFVILQKRSGDSCGRDPVLPNVDSEGAPSTANIESFTHAGALGNTSAISCTRHPLGPSRFLVQHFALFVLLSILWYVCIGMYPLVAKTLSICKAGSRH